MTGLAAFSLLRPFWLLIVPLVIGLAFVLRNRQSTIGNWEAVIDPALMKAMRALGRVDNPAARKWPRPALWATAIIALAVAGPAVEKRDAQAFRNLDGVVFVMDVSKSMTDNPLWNQFVTMGRVGVSALGSKPAALIVYAGDAYVASALTVDTGQIGLSMTLLDGKTVPDKGSRPALALKRAAEILKQSDIVSGDIVLMTDGAGLGPDTIVAAKTIAELGGRLSIVHPSPDGASEQLEALAKLGGGRLFGLSQGDLLDENLRKNTWERLELQDYLLLIQADYGRFLLFLALIPTLILFRRARS